MSPYHKSFLQWPGGKYRVLPRILPHIETSGDLYDVFSGSGVVGMNAKARQVILSDANPVVINLLEQVKDHPDKFQEQCNELFSGHYNTEVKYYSLRREFNRTTNKFRKALLFIYLTRHGFNGLCRFNQKGEFNVSFGKYKAPYFPADELAFFATWAGRAGKKILCDPYHVVCKKARRGDTVYMDPPYVPLTDTSNFTGYIDNWGLDDHRQLGREAEKLARRGVKVVVSNHDTELSRDIFKKADRIQSFDVKRTISCKPGERTASPEILVIYNADSEIKTQVQNEVWGEEIRRAQHHSGHAGVLHPA